MWYLKVWLLSCRGNPAISQKRNETKCIWGKIRAAIAAFEWEDSHNPILCWSSMPLLHPVWDLFCCCTTTEQGKIFSLIPGSTAAFPMGLLRAMPNHNSKQTMAAFSCCALPKDQGLAPVQVPGPNPSSFYLHTPQNTLCHPPFTPKHLPSFCPLQDLDLTGL